jgi:GNAT superfamily N-acetyltransferase
MRVRWAVPEDARAIATVQVSSWRAAYRGLIPDETLARIAVPEREPRWREWLSDRTRPSTLVAGYGDRIEGFCSVAMPARSVEEASDLAEIPALYVAPGAWRRGVGAALMTRALDEMAEAGFARALVWVLEGNDRAIAFYEASGWRLDGGRDEWTPQIEGADPLPIVSLRIEVGGER